ncbi:MAG: delta-60 repeat domain-containing protein [Casimicrobium sp.]
MAHLFSRMLAALALCATFTTHAAPGDLDTTFGSGSGKVITAIGTGAGTLTAVTLQPDGKIVAAGGCSSTYDFCLARYLPNGALDTTFNTTGTVITAIVASADFARALALQPDGKIVVAGTCHNGNNFDFCLARYLPSGALDTTFNTTGTVITVIGSGNDDAYALALQPDGKIVVAGSCYNGSNDDFCLARYLPGGALDTTFNTTGKVITAIGASDAAARALALQTDGKIVVAGSCYNGSNYDFCLARYLPGGALDLSFNTTGKVVTAIGSSDDHAFALALQPDGKIVAAGFCINSNEDFCLARYLPGGALDTTFNTTGKVITAIGAGHDRLVALALQPDGKIVTAGACHNASDYGFCLARHHASGALDTNLNTTGKVITDVGARGSLASALALQPDGKIVVAGYCDGSSSRDFCVARYEGGPFDARNCSMDVDGDNQTFATTDGLIAARVMLGLTGNAVIGGITFASHATRTTWPAIRDYLVTQCGMSIVP